jgi:hypothetical protein
MREILLGQFASAISTLTQFALSYELPWSQNGQPLFRKNMRKLYIDSDQTEQTVIFPVLSGSDVYRTQTTIRAYLAVDAKPQNTTWQQLQALIDRVLQVRDTGVIVAYDREADYTVEFDEDVQVYTFEFRFGVAT